MLDVLNHLLELKRQQMKSDPSPKDSKSIHNLMDNQQVELIGKYKLQKMTSNEMDGRQNSKMFSDKYFQKSFP